MDNHSAGHLELVTTADGSKTVYNALVGENYHSRQGAVQESRHVFVNAGLQHFVNSLGTAPSSVSILEVGFGTGLNFLLTAQHCIRQGIHLQYTGIEAYPLSSEMISATGYHEHIDAQLWKNFVSNYKNALGGDVSVAPGCRLAIADVKLADFSTMSRFDIIYYDAFASAHQPEMWNEAAITHALSFLKPGGIFVTYAITGHLKRIIKGLGHKVEKVPGAPGKREMLRATAV